MNRSGWKNYFKSIPDGLSLKEISHRIGCSYRTVHIWANAFGYKPANGKTWTAQRRRQFQRIDWNLIDWSKSNVRLAREHGVSREIVRVRRKEYAQPHHRKELYVKRSRISD